MKNSDSKFDGINAVAEKNRIFIYKTIAAVIGNNRCDIEDCFQDVLEIAFVKSDELLTHPNPAGWFIVTARNVARQMKLSIDRRAFYECDSDKIEEVEDKSIENDMVFGCAVSGKSYTEIIQLLSRHLNQKEKLFFTLKYIDHMQYEEISKIFQVDVPTVRARCADARKKIILMINSEKFENFLK